MLHTWSKSRVITLTVSCLISGKTEPVKVFSPRWAHDTDIKEGRKEGGGSALLEDNNKLIVSKQSSLLRYILLCGMDYLYVHTQGIAMETCLQVPAPLLIMLL